MVWLTGTIIGVICFTFLNVELGVTFKPNLFTVLWLLNLILVSYMFWPILVALLVGYLADVKWQISRKIAIKAYETLQNFNTTAQ